MSAWSVSADPEWLPKKLLEAAAGNAANVLNALEVEASGPLWELLEGMATRIQEAAAQSVDNRGSASGGTS
ncbi:MAG: hypothetical protein KAY32_12295 [Candidatus Eisenbacteria sp.]|nr:hypothetical protein [Candidatus Eisenbacteria bacterium]